MNTNCNETHTCNCGANHSKLNGYIIGGEELHMTKEEYDHLMTLPVDFSDKDWKDNLLKDEDYDTLVNALFTIGRPDDAWEVISNHKENIDFNVIFNAVPDKPCPYFQIKRDAQDVYKYMHDTNAIDDISYAYFQVIGGKLLDLDFWRSFMGDKSVSDKLRTIHECYNGNNPFELGLVILDEDARKFIFENLEGDELLDDYIIGQYPGVFFDKDLLLDLMQNNHLKRSEYHRYFSIILQMINTDVQSYDNKDQIAEVYNSFWDTAYAVLKSGISLINVNDKESLDSFINSTLFKSMVESMNEFKTTLIADPDERQETMEKFDTNKRIINTLILNSLAFMNYPHTYFKDLVSSNYDISNVRVADYLFENNYAYILTYALLNFVNTTGFIIKYPFPAIMNCVYNYPDNMIFINGEVKPYDEQDLEEFDFVDDYIYSGKIDDELFKKCSSIEEYEELVYSVRDFHDKIQELLNGEVE